jgi:predicted HAD superfamily Cof-like phosphohydrolase
MTREQRMVQEFHRAFNLTVAEVPTIPNEAIRQLHLGLIREEFGELMDALAKADLLATAKELADLLYVVYATAVACGIDLEPVVHAVHRVNMRQIRRVDRPTCGQPKPARESPPDLPSIITRQQTTARQSTSSQVTSQA